MLERFPYGKAPFVLLIVAVVSSVAFASTRGSKRPADIVIATFAENHRRAYIDALPKFEKEFGVTVEVQALDFQALEARLQSAIVANTEVPDLVEISEGTLGFFTRGPEKDFGFMDLTDWVNKEGFGQSVVAARFAPWSTRGRIYALPHDVHPVMLAYRRDLVEELGIDVSTLETWDDFVAMGRTVTKDLDGDGTIDRFALDLRRNGQESLLMLLRQRGVDLFDSGGAVAFNTPVTVDTFLWFLRETRSPGRISYEAGDGQTFTKALMDGLVLFVLTADWRSEQYQSDAPKLKGKMALMPLPAWTKGGRRTSTHGMTGLTISRTTKNPTLAWELAKFLYFNTEDLGARFKITNIIPPLKTAWDLPEFHQPNEYYSGQLLGVEYAKLAPDVPPIFASPVYKAGQAKLDEALVRSGLYYEEHCSDYEEGKSQPRVACGQGLRDTVQAELDRAEKYLKVRADRYAVLADEE